MAHMAGFDHYYAVTTPGGKLLFETVSQEEAVGYANYWHERSARRDRDGVGTICSITEKKVRKG
jgi:hypothetical protein